MGERRRPKEHSEPEAMEHAAYVQNPSDNVNARKRLVSSDGTMNIRGQPIPNLVGKVVGTVLQLEKGPNGVTRDANAASASTPEKAPIVKRRKQGDEQGVDEMELSTKAASELGDRRAK